MFTQNNPKQRMQKAVIVIKVSEIHTLSDFSGRAVNLAVNFMAEHRKNKYNRKMLFFVQGIIKNTLSEPRKAEKMDFNKE